MDIFNQKLMYDFHSENLLQTLIPKKVFPKGPDGEPPNVTDLSLWKNQILKRKVLNKINELVVIPAAVLAVLAC